MAPSTACSASLLHGVWRPVNSEERSGDETAGDADVIPGRFLPVRVAEQGSRMIGHDQGNTTEPVHEVPQRSQRLFGIEQRLRGRAAHREDHAQYQTVAGIAAELRAPVPWYSPDRDLSSGCPAPQPELEETDLG